MPSIRPRLALSAASMTAAIALASCDSMPMRSTGMAAEPMPQPTAESVPAHLQRERYAQTWKFYPGKQALYTGQVPHGMLLTTYVNNAAFGALSAKASTMPYGAIIVKENFTPDRKLAAVTVMYKAKGFNPAAGDWFWSKTAADGTIETRGKVPGCIGCHTPSKRDFVLTPLP